MQFTKKLSNSLPPKAVCCWVLLSVVFTPGCGGPDWVGIEDQESGYTIDFPSQPDHEVIEVATANGTVSASVDSVTGDPLGTEPHTFMLVTATYLAEYVNSTPTGSHQRSGSRSSCKRCGIARKRTRDAFRRDLEVPANERRQNSTRARIAHCS